MNIVCEKPLYLNELKKQLSNKIPLSKSSLMMIWMDMPPQLSYFMRLKEPEL